MTPSELAERAVFSAFRTAATLLSETELRAILTANGIHEPKAPRASLILRILGLKFPADTVAELYREHETPAERATPVIHLLDVMQPCQPIKALCGRELHNSNPKHCDQTTVTNDPTVVTCPRCRKLIELDYSDRT